MVQCLQNDGARLADLLDQTRDAFLLALQHRELSPAYVSQSRFVVDELAAFCRGQTSASPWELRERYLAERPALRSRQAFSAGYRRDHGREILRFLRWYDDQVSSGRVRPGDLSVAEESDYWATQPGAQPYRHGILRRHLRELLARVGRWCEQGRAIEPRLMLDEHFAQRRLCLRGHGWGLVRIQQAEVVTRRLLLWLEAQGHLPCGTAQSAGATVLPMSPTDAAIAAGSTTEGHEALRYFRARVDPALPPGLREPLLRYVEHLLCERGLSRRSIYPALRVNGALCRRLCERGESGFARLGVRELDEVVCALVTAPQPELLRRRKQVQALHSALRGFLRFLHRNGHLPRDLAPMLISPPCYRASPPPRVLSEAQVRAVLDSVEREGAEGRRRYAVLLLVALYGLRPVDVASLSLDAIDWRAQRLRLVQCKTGRALVLPLLPAVAEALASYLQRDRPIGLVHRRVLVSLSWPHRPLAPPTVGRLVRAALRQAGLPDAGARQMRASVATHLLRQGETLGTIQDILGHRTAATTKRYAVTDVQMLRQVLDEADR